MFLFVSLLAAAPAATNGSGRVGGFSYRLAITNRTKAVKSAPPGYQRTWKEHIQVIVGTNARDKAFSLLMRQEASKSLGEFYANGDCSSFSRCESAGSVDVVEDVTAASPNLVSADIGTVFYMAGMAHPNSMGARTFVWSRRLNRLLRQSDVFAVAPNRALRRLALSKFDNRENMTNPDDPDGIRLHWDHASIGPDGITWSFEPYELGGYLSAGSATISWSALKPYLRRRLPFAIAEIRSAVPQASSR